MIVEPDGRPRFETPENAPTFGFGRELAALDLHAQ
jgi:hypothetical protein